MSFIFFTFSLTVNHVSCQTQYHVCLEWVTHSPKNNALTCFQIADVDHVLHKWIKSISRTFLLLIALYYLTYMTWVTSLTHINDLGINIGFDLSEVQFVETCQSYFKSLVENSIYFFSIIMHKIWYLLLLTICFSSLVICVVNHFHTISSFCYLYNV